MSPDTGWFGLPKPTEAERQAALAEQGPSWRAWFYTSFSMVYLGLGLLIVDAIVVAAWVQARLNLGALAGVAIGLIYVEYLLYQFLWYRPEHGASLSGPRSAPRSALGGRSWLHPFAVGRWTHHFPAGRRGAGADAPEGPTPEEFL